MSYRPAPGSATLASGAGTAAPTARPAEWILDRLDLPPEIAEVGGQACLSEQAMSGARAATEGYVHDGRVVVRGVLASVAYPPAGTLP